MIIECKLCLKQGLSSESHIIPKSLLKDVYLHSNRDEPSKKHPIGMYDRHILCQPCEAIYMKWDGYPKTFFDNPFNNQKALAVYQYNEIIGHELFNVDYKQLKLFALTLLWRMHTTQHVNFKDVRLGHHIDRIRTLILNQDPGSDNEFSIMIGKFNYADKSIPFHISPFRRKIEGINCYVVHLYGYTLFIKVDKQTHPTIFQEIRLRESGYLFLYVSDFETSKIRDYLLGFLRNKKLPQKINC